MYGILTAVLPAFLGAIEFSLGFYLGKWRVFAAPVAFFHNIK